MTSSTPIKTNSSSTSTSKVRPPLWNLFWNGSPRPHRPLRRLIGGITLLAICYPLISVSLSTLRWRLPLQLIGWIVLAVTLVALIFGIRTLMRLLSDLGVKRLVIMLVIGYGIALFVVGFLTQSGQQGVGHWLASAASVARWGVSGIAQVGAYALDLPDKFRFSLTGRQAPVQILGAEWENNIQPTAIAVRAVAVSQTNTQVISSPSLTDARQEETNSITTELRVGAIVRVTGTGGNMLRVRAEPSREAEVVSRVPEGTVLPIVDGPIAAEGYTWWRVRSADAEGWCAAEFLAPIP